MRALTLVLLTTLLACASTQAEKMIPIATYMGTDDVTGDRIATLLKAEGIETAAVGSLGFTVSVNESQVAKAREILQKAIAEEGLKADMLK